MTIATDISGRQRTPTDGLSQARHATALAVRAGTWLRDEEANGSHLSWVRPIFKSRMRSTRSSSIAGRVLVINDL